MRIDWDAEAKTILSVMKPRPRLTISQWADSYRKLSPEASSEPGQWHTDRAEYLREIMDTIGDNNIRTVVIMSSSQVGKTECLLNAIGFFIDHDPSPMLLIEPTLDMADAVSKDRLAAMLRDTPCLRGKVAEARSRDSNNTILHKTFPGGHITLTGSNSAASLASRPLRIVFADEVDRYDASAGPDGDPVSLAAKRTITFWNRKLVMMSTPVLRGLSRIESAFETSDQRYFEVPCPDCQEYQRLRWKNVIWNKDKDANGNTIKHYPKTAQYVCEHCGACWDNVTRWAAVRRGRWVATKPFEGVAGFHLSEIYSSWVPLEDMARDWLAAQGNLNQMQTFINLSLGESWELPFEAKVEGHALLARCENYTANTLPDEIQWLTVGGDTQPDRLEISVWGFGAAEESWAIEHVILRGDLAQQDLFVELDNLLLGAYRTVSGRELRISAACLDVAGPGGQQVLNFTQTRAARRIYGIRGQPGAKHLWPARSSRSNSGGMIYMLGVDNGKDTIYSRLRGIDKPGPGYIHFPVHKLFDANYFKQLTCERVVTHYHKNGTPYRVWETPSGARNEALDCANYALAAFYSLGLRRERMVAAPAPIIPGQPPPPPSPFPRRLTVDEIQDRAARRAKMLAQ